MKKYKKKYNSGTQKVDVPPTMTGADVGASALSGAAAGAAMGSALMPGWGTAIGGVVGGAAGAVKGFTDKANAQIANTKAIAINEQADKNMNTGIDPMLQNYQYTKGTTKLNNKKVIEIEGKKFPEIHTDKNYNIKTLGSKPHTEGGTKTVAEEGDVVFDTQNSKDDYKKVMNDISLYKMKGDKNAYKRLEKRRKEMPADKGQEKNPGGNSEVKVGYSNTNYGWTPNTEIETDNLGLQPNPLVSEESFNPSLGALSYTKNKTYMAPQQQSFNTVSQGDVNNNETIPLNRVGMPVSTIPGNDNVSVIKPFDVHDYTGTKHGKQFNFTQADIESRIQPNQTQPNNTPINPDFSNEKLGLKAPNSSSTVTPESTVTPTDKPGSKSSTDHIGNIGRYANIAYNTVQAFNKPQKTLEERLKLDRYKYSDMSDPLREEARKMRATQLYNAGRAGSSIGQQQAYGQQAQNSYLDQLGQINSRENQQKQNIQNANVDVANRENQVNYERAFMNNDISQRNRAQQQAYGAMTANEVARLSQEDRNAQIRTDNYQSAMTAKQERDKQYLRLFGTKNHSYDEDLNDVYKSTYVAPEYSKGNSKIKVKSRYVYKSGTNSKKK